jgi:hypothetical protein
MVVRKSFFGPAPEHPELDRLLEDTRDVQITGAQLEEQRISFAYGNAPIDEGRITKETARAASRDVRLMVGDWVCRAIGKSASAAR